MKWGGTDFKWASGDHWHPRWRRPCIEVGLCYLRKWRRGESLLFIFETSTVDVGECIQPQQHCPTGNVAFHYSIFCQGVSSFISFANNVTNFLSFLLAVPLTCFITFFLFQHWASALTLKFIRHMFRVFWLTKFCHFFITLPTPFLLTFLFTRQVIE